MKTVMSLAAVAGVALALSFTGALAQAPAATGTGSAVQQDKPSAAGVSNPAGAPANTAMGSGMMGKKKMMKPRMKKHRKMKKMM